MATYFNPRSHEESDPFDVFVDPESNEISIHALTKRATISIFPKTINGNYFNPRSHEESDRNKPITIFFPLRFQSTLSRRERPEEWFKRYVTRYCDISIHALTKRATAIYSILWLNFYLEVLVILIVLHF